MFAVGYSVAYLFHMASCGLLFRFVEFTGLSCCVGRCGWTVDEGGPEGLGFPEGQRFAGVKSGCDLFSSSFAGPLEESSGGDGDGDGGGDGG